MIKCTILSIATIVVFFFSQNPRDFYLVGNTVEYSCADGYHLSGDALAECTENQRWRTGAMVCESRSSLHQLCHGGYVFVSIVHSLAEYLSRDSL